MQRSVKVINEELDAAEMERNRHRIGAKAIYDKVKKLDREMAPGEVASFDEWVDAAKKWQQHIENLQIELEQSQERDKQIMSNSRHPSGIVYNQASQGAPDRVLPTNGVMPSSGPRYHTFNRVGKLRAFRDEQSAYDSGQWLRAVICREFQHGINSQAEDYCNRVGLEISNVGYEGSGPAGGYLVPPTISSAILDLKERVGVSRQVCNVLPTSGDTLSVPKKTGGLTVYYPNEGAAITDSDKAWGLVSLAVQKRAVASYLTNELVDDALINIVDNVVAEMAYALALQEDNELINGTGASTYGNVQGLLSAIGSAGVSTATTGNDTWPELTMADLTACVGKLPDRYHVYGPSWICSHAFFNAVMVRLAFAAGGVTASEVMGGTSNLRSFLGYPVFLTPHMPVTTGVATKCALFGAFNQAAILADRGGVRIGRSDEYKFLEDKVTLRATSRYDISVHDRGDSSNAGAYVALATAS